MTLKCGIDPHSAAKPSLTSVRSSASKIEYVFGSLIGTISVLGTTGQQAKGQIPKPLPTTVRERRRNSLDFPVRPDENIRFSK